MSVWIDKCYLICIVHIKFENLNEKLNKSFETIDTDLIFLAIILFKVSMQKLPL